MDYPEHGELTDQKELYEMYKCGTNTHKFVRPTYLGSRRWKACLRLVKKGYMIPKDKKLDFDPDWYMGKPVAVEFTEKGEDWFLSLNPQDFSEQMFWPLPRDIEKYQKEILENREKKRREK